MSSSRTLMPEGAVAFAKSKGYHLAEIPRGVYGDASKVLEEAREFADACDQGVDVMAIVEAADLIGAVDGWLRKRHPSITITDLVRMADVTSRAFAAGHRVSR